MAKDFSFSQGDILPFYGNREVNMTRSGFSWRAGVDLRISDSDFWMTLESYQNKGYIVEVKEDFDFAVIDKLESEKLDIGGWLEGYNWYGMEISRKFEERESTVRYGNINFNIMFKWELSGETDGFFLFPEAGVNLCVLREKIQGLTREYGYDLTMFPEILWSGQPLNRYIGAYRMLRAEEEINNIRYKLNTRFFVGLNMGFRIWKFVNVFSNARIYNRSFTRSFLQKSLLGNFPFDLELNKVVLSGGISYIF